MGEGPTASTALLAGAVRSSARSTLVAATLSPTLGVLQSAQLRRLVLVPGEPSRCERMAWAIDEWVRAVGSASECSCGRCPTPDDVHGRLLRLLGGAPPPWMVDAADTALAMLRAARNGDAPGALLLFRRLDESTASTVLPLFLGLCSAWLAGS